MASHSKLIDRPPWWRLFARREWDRRMGPDAKVAVAIGEDALNERVRQVKTKRAMRGVAGRV